jgi:DNA topoisomerase-1
MPDDLRLVTGECTVRTSGTRETTRRGHVVVVHKPDDTVLVHDADGYQPVAWLTRAETVWTDDDGGLTAIDGDQRLRVDPHDARAENHPVSPAGLPVGDCPACGGVLVRTGGSVDCLDCEASHGIPRDATVLDDEPCGCGHPRLRVERGRAFEVCLDRECESLDEAVREAFDREWDCPECGDDMRILRRGGLIAGCASYPECDTGFGLPAGEVVAECDCGLPVFETGSGRRCLDTGCERPDPPERGTAGAMSGDG